MPKIVIKRTSEYRNKARKIGIYIDEGKVGTIKDGEYKEYVVESGQHSIYAKVDWCRSQTTELNLAENETKTFILDGYKYGGIVTQSVIGILLLIIS